MSGPLTSTSIAQSLSTRPRAVVATTLVMFGLLLLTNRYATMIGDAHLIQICCSDGFAYREIALSFPHLPDASSRTIDFHHAQRFFIPWLAGGLARLSGLSIDSTFRLMAIAVALGIVLITLALVREVGAAASTQVALLALFIFNAYTFRFHLGFPWYVNDLGFVLGLALSLYGLLRGKGTAVLGGIAIAAVSRQTALLLLPTLVAWLVFGGTPFSRRTRIALAIACPVLALFIYQATGRVAASFAKASVNREHLTAVFTWFAQDYSTATLLAFVVRTVMPLLPLLMVGAALAARHRNQLRTDLRFWLLVSTSAAIAVQPILAGPGVTGGATQRLVMLGLVPLVVALAHLMAARRIELPASLRFWAIFGAGAFVSSLHHIHSFIRRDDSTLALIFAIFFTLASFAMGVATWAFCEVPQLPIDAQQNMT